MHGSGRAEESPSPLAAYQKSLEETSKLVIEEPKPCVPVSMKKMSRTSAPDGKPRFNLHEEEGSSGSEPKVCHQVIPGFFVKCAVLMLPCFGLYPESRTHDSLLG